MEETLNLKYCSITFYDFYMVVVMNEGINVSQKENNELTDLAFKHYGSQPFVYITHRLNSYSVDPNIYFETSKIPNLMGFAVVTTKYHAKINAQIEKQFLKKPFEVFPDLEAAKLWASKLVKTNESS